MGQYFNPADDIKTKGRKLYPARGFNGYASQVRPAEKLVGLFDNGRWRCVPFLPDQKEFDAFWEAYASGAYLTAEFFAVDQ